MRMYNAGTLTAESRQRVYPVPDSVHRRCRVLGLFSGPILGQTGAVIQSVVCSRMFFSRRITRNIKLRIHPTDRYNTHRHRAYIYSRIGGR